MDKAEKAKGLAEPLADSDCPLEAVVALAMVDSHGPHSHPRPESRHYHLMSNYCEHWAGGWRRPLAVVGVSGCCCKMGYHLVVQLVDY